MDTKNQILQNLQLITNKLLGMSIKGVDAMPMADALAGLEQTAQLVNQLEVVKPAAATEKSPAEATEK